MTSAINELTNVINTLNKAIPLLTLSSEQLITLLKTEIPSALIVANDVSISLNRIANFVEGLNIVAIIFAMIGVIASGIIIGSLVVKLLCYRTTVPIMP